MFPTTVVTNIIARKTALEISEAEYAMSVTNDIESTSISVRLRALSMPVNRLITDLKKITPAFKNI